MFRSILSLFTETFQQWNLHKAPKMGAALAYYAVLSLAPLVILVLSLLSLLVQRDAARPKSSASSPAWSAAGRRNGRYHPHQFSVAQGGVDRTVVGFGVLLIALPELLANCRIRSIRSGVSPWPTGRGPR
ncbi:MAG: hypothetical protein WDN28_31125 [Chthoniobacter sp.]